MIPVYSAEAANLAAWRAWEESNQERPLPYEQTYLPVRTVFTVLDADVPVRRPGVHVMGLPGTRVGVFSKEQAAGGVLDGADIRLLECLLYAVDGVRSAGEVLDESAPAGLREKSRHLLQRLLGTAVELPDAVGELERRIPHSEIVRFPMQDAYAVPRAYWSNAGDVREALPGLFSHLESAPGFAVELSRLHVLATMGAGGCSFHGGGGETTMVPGRYRTRRARTHTAHPAMVAFVRERLRELDLRDSLTLGVPFESPASASLGHLSGGGCTYELNEADPTWMAARLEELRQALNGLRAATFEEERGVLVSRAAAFHHLFCHVHPFERINNSIAMNVVNACLLEGGVGCLPHLFLDHFALRLDATRYEVVFRDALARHGLPTDDAVTPVASVHELAHFRSVVKLVDDEMPESSPP